MSLIDDVIVFFATPGTASGLYTVTRTAPGSYSSAGEYSAGSASSFTIRAAVHPNTGRHNVTLPEGVRAEDVRVLWTATQLRAQDPNADSDSVLIPDGLAGTPAEPFFVFQVNGPWTSDVETFYRAYCARRRQP